MQDRKEGKESRMLSSEGEKVNGLQYAILFGGGGLFLLNAFGWHRAGTNENDQTMIRNSKIYLGIGIAAIVAGIAGLVI